VNVCGVAVVALEELAYLGAAVLRRALPQAAPVPDDSYLDTLLSALGVTPSVKPAGQPLTSSW
jgi:hypothetical protein